MAQATGSPCVSETFSMGQSIIGTQMDFICGGLVVEPTKQTAGPDCKVLVWFSSALASMPGHLNDYDFAAIAQEIYADETRRQDRSLDEILAGVRPH